MNQDKTLFEKIYEGIIPGDFLYKDDDVFAIRDIAPQAKIHILVIPRKPIEMLSKSQLDDQLLLGKLMLTAKHIAAEQGIADSFRLVINNGKEVGMTVPHLHLHILSPDHHWTHGQQS